MNIETISTAGLVAAYMLLIIPLAIIQWLRIPILRDAIVSVARMSLQLAFVGLYLQFVFALNSPLLNAAWVVVMIAAADVSIVQASPVRLRCFAWPVFLALLVGTALPLLFFVGPILRRPSVLDAQYVIPIGGMILGNCLRANIVGLRDFYEGLRRGEPAFLNTLAQGARLGEAIRPYMADACRGALVPTIATMATIGLVALPGMMTGVILAGADPMTAIKYQIAIMIAIFCGTAITVLLSLTLSMSRSFTSYGVLDHGVFRGRPKR